MNILLVDDNPELLELAQEAMEAIGHEVEAVNSGEMAILRMGEKSFEMVLLDCCMPNGMSGLETLAILMDRHPGTPVVMSSGDVLEGLPAGVMTLEKPYSLAKLESFLTQFEVRAGVC